FNVIAIARAIAIHAGEQKLAGAQLFRTLGPFDRVPANVLPASVSKDFPTHLRIARLATARINRHDHALTAKRFRAGGDQFWTFDSCRIQGDLIRASAQNSTNILNRTQATTYCERNKDLISHPSHQLA